MFWAFKRLIGFYWEEIQALSSPRSSAWRSLRKKHLEEHPQCAACGCSKNVVPHHKIPFHVDPSRELDPSNLISLCESPSFNCHLFFGHLKRWDWSNPKVEEDAAYWRARMEEQRIRESPPAPPT